MIFRNGDLDILLLDHVYMAQTRLFATFFYIIKKYFVKKDVVIQNMFTFAQHYSDKLFTKSDDTLTKGMKDTKIR